jgi:exosortase B
MSALPQSRIAGTVTRSDWFPVFVGLLVLCLPTIYDLASWLWQRDEYSHGPLILAVILWLFWRRRMELFGASSRPAIVPGFALLIAGLLLYVVGRSYDVLLFEVFALIPILAGVLLAIRGVKSLRTLWFPVFFVAFLVPLPGAFVDALTSPLKQFVSEFTTDILHFAGYPVARDGVVISAGQYRMLVADACSGLHSMFSLFALGALYMHVVARSNLVHNVIMFASILPIAFAANIVRVAALILITYHFGDEAGQGFLHGAAGIVLFVFSLLTLFLLDAVLARVLRQCEFRSPG